MSSAFPKHAPVCLARLQQGVAVLTIDRPERRNALSLEVKGLLADHLSALIADDAVRVIVLTGAGGVFVAGTDIAEMAEMLPTDHERLQTGRVFNVLRICDIIVGAEGARLGQPEIRVGIMPGAGATQRLLRTAGKYRAMKIVLTGEPINAADALAMGLLSEVVADGQALARALTIAQTIATMPPLAVKAIKEVVWAGQESPLESALQIERKAFELLFGTEDQKEGMRAFMEKRKPIFERK
jgi:enoyl-CoA hydratase/carnithine racemase